MLSGLWSDTSVWDKQVPHLHEDYTCIRLEHRGIGRSDKWQGRYSYDLHARDARELLDHLGINQAILLGVCHGGMTAVSMARCYPDRCAALIINGTSVLTSSKQRQLFEGWRAMIEGVGFREFYRTVLLPSLYSESFLTHNESRLGEIARGAWSRMEINSTLAMIDACSCFGLSEEELAALRVPALIMAGDEDGFVLQSTTERTARLWPDSEYHLFRNCGHFPQREATTEYNRVIRTYLERTNACPEFLSVRA
jgi:3-oxoadipate enol-lactonase